MIRIADPDSGSKTSFSFNHSPHRVCFNEVSLCVERHTMESADISITLFDTQQWKVMTSACHCLTHNNGNADVSMPLFDAQQWKCKSLSIQTYKSLSVWRVSLHIRLGYVVLANTSLCLPGSLSRRVSGTLNVRLGCTGQDPTVSTGPRGYNSVNYHLIYYGKRGNLWHGECMRSTECLLVHYISFFHSIINCMGIAIYLLISQCNRTLY